MKTRKLSSRPINTTTGGMAYGIKASYFKVSLTTLTGGGHHFPCTGVLEVLEVYEEDSFEHR